MIWGFWGCTNCGCGDPARTHEGEEGQTSQEIRASVPDFGVVADGNKAAEETQRLAPVEVKTKPVQRR